MKKTVTRCIALNITLLFLCACNWNKAKTAGDTLSFDTIRIDEIQPQSKYTRPDVKVSCHLDITFIYPNSYGDADKLRNLQSVFIERVFPLKYVGLPPQQAVDSFKTQYFKDFQCEKFADEDYGNLEDESDFLYYMDLKNEITYNGNGLVSFLVQNETFEGGAHGAHGVFGYVIDLNTGEYITEDAFAEVNYKKNVAEIIVRKIADANNVSDPAQLENIGYNSIDDIVPNGNFTIDEQGITYYFNEYEIAAYFIGTTKVFIPYKELEIFIADDSPIAALAKL
ncbi:MAG: DUF3298 and DUF4163 domain-containing protein [Dysgonamonadaceae bacterium]|jgi:hypothetical protein|nr:DUF3298 and DUF4163 domain-containing protein [Dysgonamonadaceae bacterium]